MKTFIKTFYLFSAVYFSAMIYTHWNPVSNIWRANFEILQHP